MKKLLVILLSLFCCLQLQAVQLSDSTFGRSPEENARIVEDCLTAMNNVLVTYEGIKDTASADAAADRLKSLHQVMQEKVDAVNKIDQSDKATQDLFFTKLVPMLFVNGARTKEAFERIRQNDYYGSEKLRQFMEVDLVPTGDPAAE